MSERCWGEPTEIKRDGSVWRSTLCLGLFHAKVLLYHSLSGLATFHVGLLLFQNNVVEECLCLLTERQDPAFYGGVFMPFCI